MAAFMNVSAFLRSLSAFSIYVRWPSAGPVSFLDRLGHTSRPNISCAAASLVIVLGVQCVPCITVGGLEHFLPMLRRSDSGCFQIANVVWVWIHIPRPWHMQIFMKHDPLSAIHIAEIVWDLIVGPDAVYIWEFLVIEEDWAKNYAGGGRKSILLLDDQVRGALWNCGYRFSGGHP